MEGLEIALSKAAEKGLDSDVIAKGKAMMGILKEEGVIEAELQKYLADDNQEAIKASLAKAKALGMSSEVVRQAQVTTNDGVAIS